MTLQATGFDIEFVGFNEPTVPMYNHKPIKTDTGVEIDPPGKVVKIHRVANTSRLNPPEEQYFHWAAMTLGFMPWPPGEACLARPFPFQKGDTLTEKNAPRGRKMGCPACRLAASQPTTRPRAAAAGVQAPSVESASIAAPAPPEALKCPECGFEPRTHTEKGKPHKDSTRRHYLGLHISRGICSAKTTNYHPSG